MKTETPQAWAVADNDTLIVILLQGDDLVVTSRKAAKDIAGVWSWQPKIAFEEPLSCVTEHTPILFVSGAPIPTAQSVMEKE